MQIYPASTSLDNGGELKESTYKCYHMGLMTGQRFYSRITDRHDSTTEQSTESSAAKTKEQNTNERTWKSK